jgi:hypothetical protein
MGPSSYAFWGTSGWFMSVEAYEVGQRSYKRGVDLISDALPFGRLWHGEPNTISNAVDYAKHRSRSHDAPGRHLIPDRIQWTYCRNR